MTRRQGPIDLILAAGFSLLLMLLALGVFLALDAGTQPEKDAHA